MEMTKANWKDMLFIILMPLLVGAIVIAVLIYNKYDMGSEHGIQVVGVLLSIWGILFGFIISTVSILLSIRHNEFIELLADVNYLRNIFISYLMTALHIVTMIVLSAIILITGKWCIIIQSIFLFFCCVIAASILITLYFLALICMKIC